MVALSLVTRLPPFAPICITFLSVCGLVLCTPLLRQLRGTDIRAGDPPLMTRIWMVRFATDHARQISSRRLPCLSASLRCHIGSVPRLRLFAVYRAHSIMRTVRAVFLPCTIDYIGFAANHTGVCAAQRSQRTTLGAALALLLSLSLITTGRAIPSPGTSDKGRSA